MSTRTPKAVKTKTKAELLMDAAHDLADRYGCDVVRASGPAPGRGSSVLLRVWANGRVRIELTVAKLEDAAEILGLLP